MINPNLKNIAGLALSEPSLDELFGKLIEGDRMALSKCITLSESTLPKHRAFTRKLIEKCAELNRNSFRLGITGVPGVGKSTFIEAFGNYLIHTVNKKVAVLAIDPSSESSHGSILGDKTRMASLSAHPNAFIRPTASSNHLGGIARNTLESILLCEAAGYDFIIIETVGVGQSETEVYHLTDFFLLLLLANAGDELQGIKRGIMELADAILINKMEINPLQSKRAKAEFQRAVHFFPPHPAMWHVQVEEVSAIEKKGLDKVAQLISDYQNHCLQRGYLDIKRNQQNQYWFNKTLKNSILDKILGSQENQILIQDSIARLNQEHHDPFSIVEEVLKHIKL